MRLQIKIFSRKLTVTHCRAAGNRITQYEHVSARTELTAIIFIADTKETQKRSSFFIEVGPMYVILFFLSLPSSVISMNILDLTLEIQSLMYQSKGVLIKKITHL